MMAPKYMRAAQFNAVVQAAVYELDEPIDWVEIVDGLAKVSAGGEIVYVKCWLEHSKDENGNPLLGSDRWETEIVKPPPGSHGGDIKAWLKGLLGRS